MTAIILQWSPVHSHPSWPDAQTDPVLWINPAKFELQWRKNQQWVGPGGIPGGQGDRYARAGEWLLSGNPINMCQIWINEEGIGFTDGRHRFAWLRDHGLSAMPVQLSPDSLAYGVSSIETEVRKSILIIPSAPAGAADQDQ